MALCVVRVVGANTVWGVLTAVVCVEISGTGTVGVEVASTVAGGFGVMVRGAVAIVVAIRIINSKSDSWVFAPMTRRNLMHWADELYKYKACEEAVEWAKSFDSFATAWNACGRGEWLAWIAAKVVKDRRPPVLAICECARLALPYILDRSTIPQTAIETTERWARGEVTMAEVETAARHAGNYVGVVVYAYLYTAFAAKSAAFAAAASAFAPENSYAPYAAAVVEYVNYVTKKKYISA